MNNFLSMGAGKHWSILRNGISKVCAFFFFLEGLKATVFLEWFIIAPPEACICTY